MEIVKAAENKAAVVKRPHALQIEGRKKAVITGVRDVLTMTETAAQALTGEGALKIEGSGMRIAKFNADEGLLIIEGAINKLQYSDADNGGGFFKKIFK